jgi:hypothetical protein
MRKHWLMMFSVLVGIVVFVVVMICIQNSTAIGRFFAGDQEETTEETTKDPALEEAERVQELIAEARIIAAGYDFDGAIAYLKEDEAYRQTLALLEEVESLENQKASMVKWSDVRQIPHIFIRPLIADEERAFDGEERIKAYSTSYITVTEFRALLKELYNNDYVLVRIHDVAQMVDGTIQWGSIYLPEGKKPLVLSEENVCYTQEMAEDGFASRLVLMDDGTLTCELDDGDTVTWGAYDLVPILEEFIEEHPDFSYRGARAVLGISGADGVLGYHTSYQYMDEDSYVDDTLQARKVAETLQELGYEFACNGYNYTGVSTGSMDDDTFALEMNNWINETASIVGTTDIFMFPNGEDVGDWHYYSGGRYETLKKLGYDYFINMNATEACWNQIQSDYVRQGRRCISGAGLYQDVQGGSNYTDLFLASKVLDFSRPVE